MDIWKHVYYVTNQVLPEFEPWLSWSKLHTAPSGLFYQLGPKPEHHTLL